MTLRIDQSTRLRLYDYMHKRAKKEGRHISLNECIVTLIREAC